MTHCWWQMLMNQVGLRGRLPDVLRLYSQEHAHLHAVSLWSSMIFRIDKLVRMKLSLFLTTENLGGFRSRKDSRLSRHAAGSCFKYEVAHVQSPGSHSSFVNILPRALSLSTCFQYSSSGAAPGTSFRNIALCFANVSCWLL